MVNIPIKIIATEQEFRHLLNKLAATLFHARSAIKLEHTVGFDIDNGLNDIRAYYNNNFITFVCRYKSDLEYITEKIIAYAIVNKLNLKGSVRHKET